MLSFQWRAQSRDISNPWQMNCGITCSALCREGLSYKDLPETEVLFFGALEELGFVSYLGRTQLRKQFAERRHEGANLRHLSLLETYAARPMAPPATGLSGAPEFARCGTKLVSSNPAAATLVKVASTSEYARLSAPGLRGLAVACRVACEMVAGACEDAMDTSLWLQVPDAMRSIDAIT